MKKLTTIGYLLGLLTACCLFSCSKDSPPDEELPEQSTDLWEFGADHLVDSIGNRYYLAATHDRRMQIRVRDAAGKTIFSEYCPTIDSTEIPRYLHSLQAGGNPMTIAVTLTAPNKYINPDDATLSFLLDAVENDGDYNRVQLIANINLSTKEFYTKKYKIEGPQDWSFVRQGGGIVQWYQNTLLVREGTQANLNGGGFMGLGARGTQLVCYERDFSVRYTKDIDVSAASYPRSGGRYIPVSDTDAIGFSDNPALIIRTSILVSAADEWAGVKPVVWQIDLKRTHNLPADYQVQIIDYNVAGNRVTATYRILDASGALQETINGVWDVDTAFPLRRL